MAPLSAPLSRRQLLQLGLGAGLLAACRPSPGPELLLVEGELPAAWLQQLPAPWRSRTLADPAAVQQQLQHAALPGLVALSDGWASGLSPKLLQPFEAPRLWARLAPFSGEVARLFGPEGSGELAFPWAYSPWVIALRSRPDLAARRREGWQLLLDPSLRGRLVLPSSPRISLEIVKGDFAQLERLRAQALAYDERNGLNLLLLSGDAEAAVLPLQRLIPLLRRDQRLAVIWPDSGAPLSWQLLLRPAARPPQQPPLDWLGAVLEPPLLEGLLARGWVPPLPQAELAPVAGRFPDAMAALLLPGDGLLQRCWSLPPLSLAQQLALQNIWDAAAPTS